MKIKKLTLFGDCCTVYISRSTMDGAWLQRGFWPDRMSYVRFMKPVGWVLTFVSVTAAMVLFRSTTMTSAVDMVKGLIGLNGIALPQALFDQYGSPWARRCMGSE